MARDRHRAFPGCTRLPVACDAHHVVHWADGGASSLASLVLLCRGHHTTIHTTPWEVRLHPGDGRPEFCRSHARTETDDRSADGRCANERPAARAATSAGVGRLRA